MLPRRLTMAVRTMPFIALKVTFVIDLPLVEYKPNENLPHWSKPRFSKAER